MNSKHTYYHTCPYCGANLDPNESCDCQYEVTEKSEESEVNNSDVFSNKRSSFCDNGRYHRNEGRT